MQIAMIAAGAAEADDPALTEDSERESLPFRGPEIAAARTLFTPPEDDSDEPRDIMKIIESCLKDAKKCKTRRAVKLITQLIAVSEYIKLRARYKNHKVCKRPNLNASIAIASRMGKGSYFAQQIRHNTIYLKQHHHLPPPSIYARNGYRTLLNNESVLHDVRAYLAAESLGTVSPRALCHHVNNIILPALGIDGKISESTAQRWLKFRLGYECKEARKGMYVDGHERPDVIKERSEFIDKLMNKYER
jgi:hypothetical protein